ncbi:class I SAM-dependent methyltransferase [Saccharomonospora viridis]|uniref:SAM-dependent methlyltransferase n=1 Tax=Saccharomonospora viridis TaxID=1852 RepID=A0A837DEA5_9PSEU|nr:class I SAM-dependent methyltransferase [Saccharomonospora viridis]KHF45770.1 SAM-dependent methlyltransferase [Saccharomonospora viridis]SFP43150.1 Methyltransferase domain-containing protein [Saccharomonospora viridis]
MSLTAEDRAIALHLTGERTVPGVPEENYWFRRHEAAYHALVPFCRDAVVLEAGCGEGYGAALLAEHAARVVAIDYDEPTTRHVAKRYPGVGVVRGNLAFLPVRTGSIDVVANLQVIEHLWDQEGFLAECHRVLRPGGRLFVTTPNRLTFTPDSDTPLNPYHTRELSPSELDQLLREAGFTVESLRGLRHGPALAELDRRHGGSIIEAQLDVVLGSLPGQAVWPRSLLADVEAVTAADFELHDDDLDDTLDLIALAVRS